MLKIFIPEAELFDSETSEFYYIKSQTLLLEHSLVSISKWESKWKKAFFNPIENKTLEETIDYVRCMTITKGVDPLVYKNLSPDAISQINAYIDDPMTATTFKTENQSISRDIITAEIIYYWMISLGIPFECDKWHLNKLLTLIKVCSIKNNGEKKMTNRQIFETNNALNEARKAKLGTKG